MGIANGHNNGKFMKSAENLQSSTGQICFAQGAVGENYHLADVVSPSNGETLDKNTKHSNLYPNEYLH